MSVDSKYQTYRGDIRAAVGIGEGVVFVTAHAEGQPTAIYRLDAEKLQLAADPLPCGAVALVTDGETLWLAGTDGRVYQSPVKKVAPKTVGPQFPSPPVALALLSQDRLAVLAGSEISVLGRTDGKVSQTLTLPEVGTCLAAAPGGQWLVAGTGKGTVTVFECEGKERFEFSASERLHEGAVTALLFENEDLRFYSAGADNKLLSTHARGRLEPEDKGRGANHTDQVSSIIWGPADRFFTGSRDRTVKSWPRATNIKPVTLKDNVTKVVALAVVQLHKKHQLVVACDDNSLRFFALDEEGKFGDALVRVHDAYARAKAELGRDEPRRREEALRELAAYNDAPSVEMISEQVGQDADHGLRLLSAQLLAASDHPRAPKLLEKWLEHNDEAVRVVAFEGLRKHLGEQSPRPMVLALKVHKADVGKLAVQALEPLAAKDDQALDRLTEALNLKTWEVRQAALTSLERVFGDSPEADLIALGTSHADLRRLALVRLFQRKKLTDARVQSAVRWRAEDPDAEVRRTAFLLSLHTRPHLVKAVRDRDPELHRQLVELESIKQDGTPGTTAEAKGAETSPAHEHLAAQIKELARRPSRERAGKPELEQADYDPLLQATASRSLDTCLRGARGLAVLHDPRAFGLLLQLSREADGAARVEVCRAMAALDDPRGIKRLRSLLYDGEASVRDAAFSALAHLHESDPLPCAESGLTAAFEDVRRRGLQVLIQEVRKSLPKDDTAPGWQLLVRALNDSFPAVRGEAFKAALNLKVGGGESGTLRFALQSIHADVRREVLTEVMAQIGEPWAWPLLLTFLNDPDPKLREESFAFALKKSKELEPLEAGLCSRYVDTRRAAVQALIKKHTRAAQALLIRALDDEQMEVRQLALDSLVTDDARPALTQVLESRYPDVRLRAAKALARHGDKAALAPLLKLATAPEPQGKERVAEWSTLVDRALEGLAELGDPEALPALVPLLNGKHASHRKLAAEALTWCARPDTLDTLRDSLQHSDPQVKYRAALGLAYAGDSFVSSVVFTDQAKQVLFAQDRLAAALTLGPAGEDQLVVLLDESDERLRNQALLLLLLLELKENDGKPARLMACLSSLMPRVRLTAARGLEVFSDPAAFAQFVVQQFNDRGDEQPWKVSAETVETLAELLAHAAPLTRARTAHLLRFLSEKEQSPWDQAWSVHAARFATEIESLHKRTKDRKPAARQYTAEQLRQLAFGAYIGLVREGSARGGPQVVRVRQTALHRILALAQGDPYFKKAALPVLVQALGDPNQPVRMQAFEHLQALGMDSATLGAEALETGHTDLGVKGLEVLTDGTTAADGEQVLESVMLSRKDALAVEAAKLLMRRRGVVPVAVMALGAADEQTRIQAINWLATEYDKDAAAQKALRDALQSRYRAVRVRTAHVLATKKDPASFEALVELLHSAHDAAGQQSAIGSLTTLGDPRTPDALLDRLENDPTGSAQVDLLFQVAASFRRPPTADRLLALMDKNPKWRKGCFSALVTVSGYDQHIEDPEEEENNRDWEKKQHPRHDAILARLMEKCFAAGDTRGLSELIARARWARGKDVEPVLMTLTLHSDEELRQSVVESLGWRLRKRGGPVEPLLKALQHADPDTQFLAAEALAKAGRGDGINVLLAGVEFLEDYDLRERAVLALGELADVRTLDLLLKIAGDDEHPLRNPAAEAIGHLGRSDKGGEVFKLLERFSHGSDVRAENAIKGLRWFNTADAWKIIRQRAADSSFDDRDTAIEMLGHNDDPATRDLLLKLLSTAEHYYDGVETGMMSARRLWGEEPLEPDYAVLQNQNVRRFEVERSLDRVCKKGEPGRILEVLPRCGPEFRDELAKSVISRPELPVEAALSALASHDARTVQLAAQIIGRAGAKASGGGRGGVTPPLHAALKKWRGAWEERRQKVLQENRHDAELTETMTPCLKTLLWAAGRTGAAADQVCEAATARADDILYKPVRLAAVSALLSVSGGERETASGRAALESAARGNDPDVRAAAAEGLAAMAPKEAAKLAGKVLDDRRSFNRLVLREEKPLTDTLRSAVGQLHYQGVALPHLVALGDVEALAVVAANRKQPEATRLGAVEGLAMMARADAEAKLVSIGRAEGEDEDIRKAAWRGLRRSKRARQRAKQTV